MLRLNRDDLAIMKAILLTITELPRNTGFAQPMSIHAVEASCKPLPTGSCFHTPDMERIPSRHR